MDWSELKDRLQILTPYKVTNEYLGQLTGTTSQNISKKVKNKSEVTVKELEIFQNMFDEYNDDRIQADVWHQHHFSVTLDYYPNIFGSCGTGYFVSSEEKEQIQVPLNALFKQLSKGKKYSVINAEGNSMSPYIEPGDKLIIEHMDNQPIVDNHVYVFCYDSDLYIKRLYKNIDEIIAKSDNPDPIFKIKSIPKTEWNNLQLIGEIVGLMRELR